MKPEKIDTITIKIPHSFTKQLDKIAEEQDRTRSAVMRRLVQEYLEDYNDMKEAEKIIKEYEKNPNKKYKTLEQVMKSCGITKADLAAHKDDFSDCD